MENIKNKPKFTSKAKKLFFVALCSLSLVFGLVGAFSRPYVAFADSIEDTSAPYTTKYHPLGNAVVTFDTWGITSAPFKPTSHDYPRSIGGLLGTDDLGNTDMYDDTYVRASHDCSRIGDIDTTLYNHTFFQDGHEIIRFSAGVLSSNVTQAEKISIMGNGARALVIATNFILKDDCNAVRRYQFEVPKGFYKIKLIGQLLYKNGLRTLTFTTPIIDNDYYPYSDYFPLIASNNTTFARINLGQLLSELTGEVFDARRNDFVCINNLNIEFIAYQYPASLTTRTIYTKSYLDDYRSYVGAVSEYNSLMYQYLDNPTISLFSPVNAFLNMEIFNGFTMGYLLLICIGFSLFTLLAKVLHNS